MRRRPEPPHVDAWRRVLVPVPFPLRERHGVIQATMGWEGIHLFGFCLRAERYGSWELAASASDVMPATAGLCEGAWFGYEYQWLARRSTS